MPISFRCPHCHQDYTINSRSAGHEIQCRGCFGMMRVPGEGREREETPEMPAMHAWTPQSFDASGKRHEGPTARKPRRFPTVLVVVGILTVAVVVALGAMTLKTLAPDVGTLPSSDAIELPNDQPHADFNSNIILAEKNWAGKKVRFGGVVTRIDQDRDGFVVDISNSFLVYPSKRGLDQFAKVQIGDNIRVECVITGYLTEPFIKIIGKEGRFLGHHK